MSTLNKFAEISLLAGDPARAAMLNALMDGRALTAGELARVAGVAPQTASGHLGRLLAAGMLIVERQGRHRYHRLAGPEVAQMLETIMQVAAGLQVPAKTFVVGPKDQALRAGRTCYDHLAGQLGVAIADALVREGYVELGCDGGIVTDAGYAALGKAGVDVAALKAPAANQARRLMCRPCLDWSERRPHIAGRLGAALCTLALEKDWVRRIKGSRAISLTPGGRRKLMDAFGVAL
ncbi:MAG: winged helix-turn-helix domain-containing protein [Hyphomicrobiaceae bacterium]